MDFYQPLRALEEVLSEFKDLEEGNKKEGIMGSKQLLQDLSLYIQMMTEISFIIIHYNS